MHPHLLEISAWPWLERLSRREQRRVTLGDVRAAEWDSVSDAGFDLVFLMGVWRRSAIGREMAQTDPVLRAEYDRVLPGWKPTDVPGSPYCIQAYEPDERMGGWAGLDAARDEPVHLPLQLIRNQIFQDGQHVQPLQMALARNACEIGLQPFISILRKRLITEIGPSFFRK